MKNAMYDYERGKQSQHGFARRFIQSHYDPADWAQYADDESMTIIHIERWLDSINADDIFISRLHVLYPRDGSPDVMFVIEFDCKCFTYLDDILKRWHDDSNFSAGMDNLECYKTMFTCGTDTFKLIVQPTY
jgi:hypothetical protein